MNSGDPDYEDVVGIMRKERTLIVPAGILAEVTYVVSHRFGDHYVLKFLQTLVDGDLTVEWNIDDLTRATELVERYQDLPLGYADAAVIACAERHGGKVLTLDRRHFGVVEREGTIQVLP